MFPPCEAFDRARNLGSCGKKPQCISHISGSALPQGAATMRNSYVTTSFNMPSGWKHVLNFLEWCGRRHAIVIPHTAEVMWEGVICSLTLNYEMYFEKWEGKEGVLECKTFDKSQLQVRNFPIPLVTHQVKVYKSSNVVCSSCKNYFDWVSSTGWEVGF